MQHRCRSGTGWEKKPKPTGKIVSDKSYLNDSKGDELARSANKKNMARTSLISPTV